MVKTWRGVELGKQSSSYRNYECWASDKGAWKAETFDGGKLWYARLRIGVYRFHGEGSSMTIALNRALTEAMAVGIALQQISNAMAP
jgi:hypothetical protein